MSTQETSLRLNTAAIYKSANPIAAFCNAVQECDARNDAMKYKS